MYIARLTKPGFFLLYLRYTSSPDSSGMVPLVQIWIQFSGGKNPFEKSCSEYIHACLKFAKCKFF